MNDHKGRTYLYLALLIGILFHGVLVFSTFERTFDAYVHIFFSNHYAEHWFDHWSYKWYTGFSLVSYPPLIHQLVALFSFVIGLKASYILVSVLSIAVFIRGSYVFSRLWVDERSAGMAAILSVVATSFVEAVHVFGQLPSVTGVGILLNATPYIYKWIRSKRLRYLILSVCFLAVITTAHHVTTIFGVVFFIFPVIGLALMDNAKEEVGFMDDVKIGDFLRHLVKIIIPGLILGVMIIIVTVIMIFPYWAWSASDPINQVPIPHGSRDSFINVFSSATVFFLIPWGLMLFFFPFLIKQVFRKRSIILALSLVIAMVLGTGGTTPIPRMVLGDNAFNILTLDRFTFWASVMSLPFFGAFISSLLFGEFKQFLLSSIGPTFQKVITAIWVGGLILSCGMVVNLGYFQPNQPTKIDIKPIQNFLKRDQHDEWRYLTLGFGDQVAWLSANTDALTVDGNYHSVRRLPELTTRKVERLENAKYQGTQGLGALHQFLTVPEKYNLKYIFSNDKFYNPILYFSGWTKLRNLENNIEVWEKPDIPSLSVSLHRNEIPYYQQLMWGILPITGLVFLFFFLALFRVRGDRRVASLIPLGTKEYLKRASRNVGWLDVLWSLCILMVFVGILSYLSETQKEDKTPENLITAYFDAIDYQEYTRAFGYYEKGTDLTLDQLLLDLSQEDGLILSYAKLKGITIKTEYKDNGQRAKVRVAAEWLTSINLYTSYHDFELSKNNNAWSIMHSDREVLTPPEQIFSSAQIEFKDQGRRDALTTGTVHQDVLDRPEVYISKASLVQNGSQYYVIGKVDNVDNDPAYLTITAILYDEDGEEMVSYNVKEKMIHNLVPKESTYFRVDFEDMMYQLSVLRGNGTFDPYLSNPYPFEKAPASFKVFVKSLVSTSSLYKHYGISDLALEDKNLTGSFINTGTKECNIPQVLSAYTAQDTLVWVASEFLEKAVRPHRTKNFNLVMPQLSEIHTLALGDESNLFVNGISNRQFYNSWSKNKQFKENSLFKLNKRYQVDVVPTGYIVHE